LEEKNKDASDQLAYKRKVTQGRFKLEDFHMLRTFKWITCALSSVLSDKIHFNFVSCQPFFLVIVIFRSKTQNKYSRQVERQK
jgi:hypothetical protein